MSPHERTYAGLICDLDGVVYRGPEAVPGAVEALSLLDLRIQYATNNASRTPGQVAKQLAEFGLDVRADDVATSAQAGAAELAATLTPGAAVLAIGGLGVAEALTGAGLAPVFPAASRPVQAVLQGYGPQVTATDLSHAAYAVQAGADWVVTNTDRTLPTERGIAPGNGTLVEAVATAVGHPPRLVAGKPYAPLYVLCANRIGAEPSDLLAVGDRLETDIAGAHAAGMDSLLVLTGVSDLDQAIAAAPQQRPTYLAPDLTGLSATLARPWRADGEFRCGADRGRVEHGQWFSVADGPPLDAMSNLLAAAYALIDSGQMTVTDAAAMLRSATNARLP